MCVGAHASGWWSGGTIARDNSRLLKKIDQKRARARRSGHSLAVLTRINYANIDTHTHRTYSPTLIHMHLSLLPKKRKRPLILDSRVVCWHYGCVSVCVVFDHGLLNLYRRALHTDCERVCVYFFFLVVKLRNQARSVFLSSVSSIVHNYALGGTTLL